MKRELLQRLKQAILCLFLLPAAKSYGQIDIIATQSVPTNGATITGGQAFSVGLAVKNNSTTDIKATDVFIITCYVDLGSKKDTLACATFTGPFTAIAKGASVGPFTVSCTYNVATSQSNVKLCQSVYLQGKTDPNPGDNVSCSTVNLVAGSGGSGGHNTGTPQYSYLKNLKSENAFPFASSTQDKMQCIFLTGDFKNSSSAPAPSGKISKLYFRNVSAANVFNMNNVILKLGQSTATTFSSNVFLTGLTQVFSAATYSVSTPGWIEFALSTPFQYDNTKSLIVEASGKDGFFLTADATVSNRRLFGSSTATSGTINTGLPEVGFDIGGTGIDNIEHASTSVYPNPATDQVFIVSENNTGGRLLISDLSGKTVIAQAITGHTTTVQVSGLANGLYLYQLVNNEGLQTGKGKLVVSH